MIYIYAQSVTNHSTRSVVEKLTVRGFGTIEKIRKRRSRVVAFSPVSGPLCVRAGVRVEVGGLVGSTPVP